MIETTDQLGQELELPQIPRRIVSLVPSITEFLVDLGLRDRLVGCTKFCVHPEGLRHELQVIGGTKNPKPELIRALEPDLVIANQEENRREDVEAIREFAPVWVSRVRTLIEAEELNDRLGKLFQRQSLAMVINCRNADRISTVATDRGTALYLIWNDPYMSVGGDTFIHDVLTQCGYQNLLADRTRYPELSEEELQVLNPAHVLLSSEPFPFRAAHLERMRELCPGAEVRLVNGEFFSWYGSRIGKSRP